MRTVRSFCFALIATLSSSAFGSLRYVDGTNGDDANDGNTLATAWETIQYSFDNAASGDTVYIRGGTYIEHVELHVSNVTFSNYQGEEVIIDGDPALGSTILTIEGVSQVKISGLVLQGLITPDATGILVLGGDAGFVDHVWLEDIEVRGIGWTDDPEAIPSDEDNAQPIIIMGETNMVSFPLLEGLNVHDNITGFSEAISLDGNVVNFQISDCAVHDNTNIGIQLGGNYGVSDSPDTDHARGGRILDNHCWNNVSNYATSAGIYVDGGWDTFIERNICEGNGYGIEIGCEENGTTQNIRIQNNILRANHEAGLAIGGYTEATTGQVIDCTVRNNTFFQNDLDGTGSGELYITKASDCSFSNNIIQPTAQAILFSREDIVPQNNNAFDYTAWSVPNTDPADVEVNWGSSTLSGFDAYLSTTGWDAHGFFADPLFADPGADPPDLSLLETSPCIDTGDPSTFILPGEEDAWGSPRLSGSIVDIGAFEFQHPDGVPVASLPGFGAFPNPFDDQLMVRTAQPYERLDLLDATGRRVLSFPATAMGVLNTEGLPGGTYVLRFSPMHAPPVFQRVVKR